MFVMVGNIKQIHLFCSSYFSYSEKLFLVYALQPVSHPFSRQVMSLSTVVDFSFFPANHTFILRILIS